MQTFFSWAGVSRSATIIIAYLMRERALNVDSATLLVRKSRPVIYPNPGFQSQLYEYGKRLKAVRYDHNQRARYNDDYVTVSQIMDKEARKERPAGLEADFHQLNMNSTKDRLGPYCIVNKGIRYD